MKRSSTAASAIGVLMVLGLGGPAHAEETAGGLPGDWLSRYTGPRTAGLGSAFVAAADAPLGVLWNPSGLSFMEQNEVMLESGRLFDDTAIHGFGLAIPGRWLPSFGLSVVALRSGEFERTNELNESLGSFQDGETAFVLTASKNVSPRFAVGTNLKVVHQSIENWSASGFGADVGALVDVAPGLRLGATVLNVGGPSLTLRQTAEKYPTELRGGAALRLLRGRGLISLEVDRPSGASARLHAGSEYWVHSSLALRLGYDDAHASGGFSYRVRPQMQLDYAASDHDLGLTHRFGMSYRFGGFFASARAVPAIFSPTGEQSVTKIHLQARTKADAESWSLQIVNKSNEVVRDFGGKGVPPAHLVWDGKDAAGLPLPDGVYRYQLTVVDGHGRTQAATTRALEISTTGPQGSVPVDLQQQ